MPVPITFFLLHLDSMKMKDTARSLSFGESKLPRDPKVIILVVSEKCQGKDSLQCVDRLPGARN